MRDAECLCLNCVCSMCVKMFHQVDQSQVFISPCDITAAVSSADMLQAAAERLHVATDGIT